MKVDLKKQHFALLFLLFAINSNSQTVYQTNDGEKTKSKPTFLQFDFSIPLTGNPDRDVVDPYTHEKGYWFIPDGLNAIVGFGIHKNQWLAIGINSGINWKITEKLVAVPVFGSLKISPKLSKNDETRIFIAIGFGKSFALGRGNLSGNYRKISIGIETDDHIALFLELSEHGLKYNNFNTVPSVSVGISITRF
ncbi:hypothetical protein [Flavobacterium sp.]|uniref:hypothetical protein n=1 Tax=Flavobacterium sp. TaxID=239 RepID=UPI00286ADE4D|nr:hypothetical protein [Flavobacterium sp.]